MPMPIADENAGPQACNAQAGAIPFEEQKLGRKIERYIERLTRDLNHAKAVKAHLDSLTLEQCESFEELFKGTYLH